MNEKFYNLPRERQRAIINAGFKGFHKYGYKKASMSEVAAEAGISKSLVFHYFKNKKAYYLYLFDYALKITMQTAKEEINPSEKDFFKIFIESARIKSRLLKEYPYLSRFMMSAYYEECEEVANDLKKKIEDMTSNSINSILMRIDKNKFKNDVNIEQLIKIVLWAGEGYMKEKYHDKQLDIVEIELGYNEILEFFRKVTYKETHQK